MTGVSDSRFVTSPSRISTPSRCTVERRARTVLPSASSRTIATTRWPASSSAGMVCQPTNPFAPVTRMVAITLLRLGGRPPDTDPFGRAPSTDGRHASNLLSRSSSLLRGPRRSSPLGPRTITVMADAPGHAGPDDRDLRVLMRGMPKSELHLHLDGSLRPSTALDLIKSRGIESAPRNLRAVTSALVAPAHGADQASLLRAFDLPIALLQDAEALERCASELVEDKAADEVRYVEIRWAPLLHVRKGLPLLSGIAAV